MSNKIEIVNLKKKLRGNVVLDGITMSIKEGESYTVIGQSGVGKSVLIKHLIGLLKPDSGDVFVDGEKLDFEDRNSMNFVRRKFGMLFQGGALFDSLNVGENILFALDHLRPELKESEKREMMQRSLALVELSGIEELMISSLSGGMMKRVALARAIVAEPSIILFDEPTTGLDPITTANINDMIFSLKKKLKTTFVIVTHDMKSVKLIADTVGMLYKGKLIFNATWDELESTEDPYVLQFIRGKSEGPITDEYNASIDESIRLLRTGFQVKKER